MYQEWFEKYEKIISKNYENNYCPMCRTKTSRRWTKIGRKEDSNDKGRRNEKRNKASSR